MKTQFTILFSKITCVLFVGLSICQYSCVEDIDPMEIAPTERNIPAQPNFLEPNPKIKKPDRLEDQERLPNTRKIEK